MTLHMHTSIIIDDDYDDDYGDDPNDHDDSMHNLNEIPIKKMLVTFCGMFITGYIIGYFL
jgi:hypothetical protein